ncbi:hypothetical protein HY357_02505 [Candidatus Roizmanbacteria bacterium]|nr:hypothetical protein [Candidatus Roizmanbacteria bacterium]
MIALFFLLVAYAFFYGILLRQKQKIDNLSTQKKDILEFLLANKETEAKFVYFRNKHKQLSDILEGDVNFYPYYFLLKDSLKSSTPEAILDSVVIDKAKTFTFSVSIEDFPTMLSFLRFAESDDFLKNFNQLILSSFSNTQTSKKGYELGFRGVFIDLNEN